MTQNFYSVPFLYSIFASVMMIVITAAVPHYSSSAIAQWINIFFQTSGLLAFLTLILSTYSEGDGLPLLIIVTTMVIAWTIHSKVIVPIIAFFALFR